MSDKDVLVERIRECETVIDKMDSSDVWAIISKDCIEWVKYIDDRWQEVNGEKLEELRIMKLAYNHLLKIKERYKQDLESAKKMLNQYTEQDVSIMKDYDNESVE